MDNGKYRLLTRSDFDGLVCAVLLKELDMIDEIVSLPRTLVGIPDALHGLAANNLAKIYAGLARMCSTEISQLVA